MAICTNFRWHRDQLYVWVPIRSGDSKQLRKFSCFLSQCICAMKGCKHFGVLNSPDTLRQVVQKLPPYLRNAWLKEAHSVTVKGNLVTLHDVAKFIELEADIASDPIFGTNHDSASRGQGASHACKEIDISSFAVHIEPSHRKTCLLCNEVGHAVQRCALLLGMNAVSDRKTMLRERGLCFSCFGRGHISRFCRKRLFCEVCLRGHPTALHTDKEESKESRTRNDGASISCNSDADTEVDCNRIIASESCKEIPLLRGERERPKEPHLTEPLKRTVADSRRLRRAIKLKSTPLNASEIADACADESERLKSLSEESRARQKQTLKKSSSFLDPFWFRKVSEGSGVV